MRCSETIPWTSRICTLIVVGIAVIVPTSAVADVVVNDPFDAGVIDPAWTVTFDAATDWTYEIASSWLVVSDIAVEEGQEGWSNIILSQDFAPLGDLSATVDLAWDSEETRHAMQNIMMVLVDRDNEWVAWASYHDAWDANFGRISAGVGESIYQGPNDLPLAGTGNLTITRSAGQVTIYWNDSAVVLGDTLVPVSRLELWFQIGIWPTATFGELSVDFISCEGAETTPTDVSSWGRIKAIFR